VGYPITIGLCNFHFSSSFLMYRYSKCQRAMVIIDMAGPK